MTHRLPADPLLERDVIAACLLRPESIATIGVSEDDFALEPHRKVWHAMQTLMEIGEPVDLARVRSRLIDSDSLAEVGGETFLATLRQTVSVKSLPLDRLKKFGRLRALRSAAESVANAAAGNDPDMASAALDSALALNSDAATGGPKTARQLADEWQSALGRDPNENTVSPGLPALKRILRRLDAGSMTIVGAPVNVGKSTLALEMALHSILDGESAGYLSMEDPERIVTERIMSMLGGISPKKVRWFKPGHDCAPQVDKAVRAMHAMNDRLLVSNCVGMNERETLGEMAAMAKSGCKLIILDYIGVVGCSQRQQDRRNEIRWIATRFKARAARTKTALVVVSQLQRPKDGEMGRKPNKHSFREAGDLEAMAEYAVIMWRTVEDDFAPVYCELVKSKTGGVGYGWTMQRELYREGTRDPGSSRLVEVAHLDDAPFYDDDGNKVSIRDVMPDHTNGDRWKVGSTDR